MQLPVNWSYGIQTIAIGERWASPCHLDGTAAVSTTPLPLMLVHDGLSCQNRRVLACIPSHAQPAVCVPEPPAGGQWSCWSMVSVQPDISRGRNRPSCLQRRALRIGHGIHEVSHLMSLANTQMARPAAATRDVRQSSNEVCMAHDFCAARSSSGVAATAGDIARCSPRYRCSSMHKPMARLSCAAGGLNPHDPCDSPLVACCLLNVLHGNEPNRRGCLKWQLHAVETQYCGVDQEDKQLSLYTCNETDGQQHYMCFKHAGTGRV
jgi:hypothetical protein